MPKNLSLRLRITSKGVIPVPEDESQHDVVANGERASIAALATVSATPSYLRKRQAAKNSCDDHNVKKQKIEEVGLYKASLHAPCTTRGPMTLEVNKLESCPAKSAQPGLRRPNRCPLLGRAVETANHTQSIPSSCVVTENCGQNAVFVANHTQSIPSSCTRANGSSIKTLRDKSSERSLSRHDRYGCSRSDCVVQYTLALPAPRPGFGYDGHKIVRKEEKDSNISTVAPTAASDCAAFAVEMSPKKASRAAMLKRRCGDTSKCAIRIPEEKSRNHILTYGEKASTNVSATLSYTRKRQTAEMSHDDRNEKKQKMDPCLKIGEVGLYKAALNAPRATCGPMSLKEKKESNRCLSKTIKAVKPGSRRPTRSSLSKITTPKVSAENCVQNPPAAANHRQSVQSSCTHASGSSVPALSDKSSKSSLSGHDRSGYSRRDCEVKYASALPANGHGVVLKEDKDANIWAATTTGAYVEECITFTVQMSPKKALRAAMLKSRFADIIFKAKHQGNPNNVQEEKEILERERQKENARIKAEIRAASRRLQNDSKLQHEKERVAARMALEKLKETVEVVDNLAVLKEFMALSPPSEDEYGSGKPLQRLGLFLKEDYLEDEECSLDNTPGDMH